MVVHTPEKICGPFVGLGNELRVHVERGAGISMAESPGDCSHVHAG